MAGVEVQKKNAKDAKEEPQRTQGDCRWVLPRKAV